MSALAVQLPAPEPEQVQAGMAEVRVSKADRSIQGSRRLGSVARELSRILIRKARGY